jgi:hypothetical protein
LGISDIYPKGIVVIFAKKAGKNRGKSPKKNTFKRMVKS